MTYSNGWLVTTVKVSGSSKSLQTRWKVQGCNTISQNPTRAHHLPYIFPSSERIIFRRPQGGYMASASWKDCSISGDQTPSASFAMSTGLFVALPSSTELAISRSSWSEILAVLWEASLKKLDLNRRESPASVYSCRVDFLVLP